jgi:hypothetical protein
MFVYSITTFRYSLKYSLDIHLLKISSSYHNIGQNNGSRIKRLQETWQLPCIYKARNFQKQANITILSIENSDIAQN